MLTGKRFELTKSTLALDVVVRQGWITIPAGAIIRVIAGPNGEGDQMIDVLWEGRMLTMYAIDVTAGFKPITDRGVTTGGQRAAAGEAGRRGQSKRS